MPFDCDIIRDNGQLGLLVYRPFEAKFGKPDPANNKAPIDAATTIQALVVYGTIPDSSQPSLKAYIHGETPSNG
jgi:hypothetical protein